MFARFRSKNNVQDTKEIRESSQILNVNEEYLGVLRTKSYAEFFIKAQSILVNDEPNSSSLNFCQNQFSEILLEPQQETIKSLLESANFLSRKSDLKALLFNYFDISAEASKICSHLLRTISELQSNHHLINQIFQTIDYHSPNQLDFVISEIRAIIFPNNSLSDLNQKDFNQIHDKYSSVLQHLKSKKKSVARRIKLIKFFNKASGVCVTVAKGTYILNRGFDTMSRLVTRLHDEIEHNKEMINLCLDKREDRFSLQILKELRRSDFGFRQQVEELEEHVYLCLVTINRARSLVVKEIAKSCKEKSV